MAGRLAPVHPADITGLRAHDEYGNQFSGVPNALAGDIVLILIIRTASVRQNHLTDITKPWAPQVRSLDAPECSRPFSTTVLDLPGGVLARFG
jgi:hypothetical protein